MQGLPVPDMDISMLGMKDLYNIAGQGFFAASVGTMLLAVFLNEAAPWWSTGHGDISDGSRPST